MHDRGVVQSEPGLYFVGLFFLYALASSLIGGVGRDAEHIAKHIASSRRNGRPVGRARARRAGGAVLRRRSGIPPRAQAVPVVAHERSAKDSGNDGPRPIVQDDTETGAGASDHSAQNG